MTEETSELVPEEELSLAHEVKSLREKISQVNSIKYRLLLGVVGGVGTAIGATVVAAVLFVVISRVILALGFGESALTDEIQRAIQQ